MSIVRTTLRTMTVAAVAVAATAVLVLTGMGAGVASAQGKDVRIEFAPGESGTSFAGGVIRGDRDYYHLEALAGQTMSVGLVSSENNAVFAIYSPSGYVLASEDFDRSVVLPESGDYILEIGSVRGNSSYNGYVWIGWQ